MSITEEIYGMYREMGICSEVLEYGMRAEKKLAERFENIDRIAEYNQLKVLNAMQKNHVSESHFGASRAMAILMQDVIRLNRCMRMYFTRKPHL